MGAGNGARPREPEASGRRVVVVIEGRSPRLSNAVAAAARTSVVGEVSLVAKRVCRSSELLRGRNRHELS